MREIPGYPNYYATINGDIISGPKRTRKGFRKLKQHKCGGYLTIDLVVNNKANRRLVHRLVAATYIPNPKNKPEVNHINGIKNDNRVENLEWVTKSENQLHSIRIGLRSTVGEKNSQCKLTESEARIIKYSKERTTYLSKMFNVSPPTICDIRKNRSWTHI